MAGSSRSFERRGNRDEERQPFRSVIGDAVRNTGGRDDQHAFARVALFVADGKTSASLQHEVKLVGAFMSMHALALSRLETIQSNHHPVAAPKGGLVKLLRLRTRVFLPVVKVAHARNPG